MLLVDYGYVELLAVTFFLVTKLAWVAPIFCDEAACNADPSIGSSRISDPLTVTLRVAMEY